MRWTPDKIAELRKLAPIGIGSAGIAARLGCSVSAVHMAAFRLAISIDRNPWTHTIPPPQTLPGALRQRWAVLIGPMKEQLRSEIAATAEDVPGAAARG